jgi:hypothetical protein
MIEKRYGTLDTHEGTNCIMNDWRLGIVEVFGIALDTQEKGEKCTIRNSFILLHLVPLSHFF